MAAPTLAKINANYQRNPFSSQRAWRTLAASTADSCSAWECRREGSEKLVRARSPRPHQPVRREDQPPGRHLPRPRRHVRAHRRERTRTHRFHRPEPARRRPSGPARRLADHPTQRPCRHHRRQRRGQDHLAGAPRRAAATRRPPAAQDARDHSLNMGTTSTSGLGRPGSTGWHGPELRSRRQGLVSACRRMPQLNCDPSWSLK